MNLRLAGAAGLLLALAAGAAAGEAFPLWDGKESVADYARRVNLPLTDALDLGGGVKLELVLIPAGRFIMGTPEPVQPKETVLVGQLILATGGIFLLVLLAPVVWRWLRQKRRFQYSLGRFILMILALAIMVGGGIRWYQCALAWREYVLAVARYSQANDEEKPAHTVTLTQPFYLSRFEVTQDQYQAVTGGNPSHFRAAMNPVEQVSWDDAQEFSGKLSATSSKTIRLPTEAEWECACRAGTTTAYWSGDKEANLARAAWYCANSSGTTHPVGQKEANAFGLYDMNGNVCEWCQDWFEPYGAGPQTDPVGPVQGAARVLRGSVWSYDPQTCRSADRGGLDPGFRDRDVGFRVVVVPASKTH